MKRKETVTITEDDLRQIIHEILKSREHLGLLNEDALGSIIKKSSIYRTLVQKFGAQATDGIVSNVIRNADGVLRTSTKGKAGRYVGAGAQVAFFPITSIAKVLAKGFGNLSTKAIDLVSRGAISEDTFKGLYRAFGWKDSNPFWIVNRIQDGRFQTKQFFKGNRESLESALRDPSSNLADMLSDSAKAMSEEGTFAVVRSGSAGSEEGMKVQIRLGPESSGTLIDIAKVRNELQPPSSGVIDDPWEYTGSPELDIPIGSGLNKSVKAAMEAVGKKVNDLQLIKSSAGDFITVRDVVDIGPAGWLFLGGYLLVSRSLIENWYIDFIASGRHLVDQAISGIDKSDISEDSITDVFSNGMYLALATKQGSLYMTNPSPNDGKEYPLSLGGRTFAFLKQSENPNDSKINVKILDEELASHIKGAVGLVAELFKENPVATAIEEIFSSGDSIDELEITYDDDDAAIIYKDTILGAADTISFVSKLTVAFENIAELIQKTSKADISKAFSDLNLERTVALNLNLYIDTVEERFSLFTGIIKYFSNPFSIPDIDLPFISGDDPSPQIPTVDERIIREQLDTSDNLEKRMIESIKTLRKYFDNAGDYYAYENDGNGNLEAIQGFNPKRSNISVSDAEASDIADSLADNEVYLRLQRAAIRELDEMSKKNMKEKMSAEGNVAARLEDAGAQIEQEFENAIDGNKTGDAFDEAIQEISTFSVATPLPEEKERVLKALFGKFAYEHFEGVKNNAFCDSFMSNAITSRTLFTGVEKYSPDIKFSEDYPYKTFGDIKGALTFEITKERNRNNLLLITKIAMAINFNTFVSKFCRMANITYTNKSGETVTEQVPLIKWPFTIDAETFKTIVGEAGGIIESSSPDDD